MSNLRPDSVIACLDAPTHIQAVLNASIWAAKMLQAPLGMLYASPQRARATAIDYSGCLVGDDDVHMLNQFTLEEKDSNGKLNNQGRALLKQANEYCQQKKGRYDQPIYTLHRHATVAASLDYVDKDAQLVVIGHQVTCKNTLAQLIRMSDCPVLVTHTSFTTPKTALFAFDNRPTCHALLDWLCDNALVRNMTVHVVMVGDENETNKDAVREAYARLKQAGIKCKKALVNSRDITAALMYYQQEHQLDLLMTGAFGESRLRELLRGSDTRELLKASSTPYLLYPRM